MQPSPVLPDTFSAALHFLRKRARLTQDELGRSVGYSREQIARLENGSRLPDLVVVAALFVPALMIEKDRALVEQFLRLAGQTRHNQQITITRTKETHIRLIAETADAPSHTPPMPMLPLLGRQAEMTNLLNYLQTTRLLTIVGAPGIGKTRLALELAHAALGQFADGVVFISLAETTTTADIPYTILRHLSLTPDPQQQPTAVILAYLTPRRLLLVLDNCEHLLEGATLFTDWLAHAPHIKLLCTSRVPLDLYGEQEWPLAPLATPDLAERPSAQWADYPALQLLLARVQAADPDFALTDDNLLPVATLCVALDGLPLALELAAGRLRELSPTLLVQQFLAQNEPRQLSSTWLQQTRRNVAERHHTMQATLNWSMQLLPEAVQAVFFRLGVFVGGGTEVAAQAIALADPLTLTQLARAHLIQLENGRFRLLETIRAFGLEQLTATDQLLASQQAHAHYYAEFAQAVFKGLLGDEQGAWMQWAITDHDNCLAALRWALAQEDGETAVAIAGGLWWFWTRRGYFALGRGLLTSALALPSTHPFIRAAALNGLANFCLVDEDYAANFACHEEGLILRRQIGESHGIYTVLHNMGLTAFTMGNYEQAMALLTESVAAHPDGDLTSAWAHMGLIAQETQNLAEARHWLEQAYQSTPSGWSQAFVMNYLADVLREMGDLAEAKRLAQESLRLFTELDDSYYRPDAHMTLAQIALVEADYETAVTLITLAHEQYAARDDRGMVAEVLLFQAELTWAMGKKTDAVALFDQSRTLRQTITRAVSPREQAQYQKLAAALL
jgi:predicted ATPase/transcriptional regulator with XRE-family HTH domain